MLDEYKKLCRGSGTENEDYYSFGLPILAPAEGTVVKVTNLIPDNTPPTANWEQSWSNYVIIDHGSNEFSEISHFKKHSIVVREGDKVVGPVARSLWQLGAIYGAAYPLSTTKCRHYRSKYSTGQISQLYGAQRCNQNNREGRNP